MIYFVTPERLKDFTVILGNVDEKLINPLIPSLSDMRIKDYLGTLFYNEILTEWNDAITNQTTLTTLKEELVSIIQFALMWRACADVVLTSSYQVTNKGVQEQYGVNSTNAELGAIGMISRHYNQKAEYYETRLQKFLKLNWNEAEFTTLASLDNNSTCRTDVVPNKTTKPYNKDINFF